MFRFEFRCVAKLILSVLCITMSCGLLCVDSASAQLGGATNHKNVLFILADDWGADRMGLYAPGNVLTPPTPVLDKIAANGVRFTKCWANPYCTPTRACFLTGRHGFRTGVGNVGIPLPFDEFTIAEAMNVAGYATGCFGKWHMNGNGQGDEPLHPNLTGFDYYAGNLACCPSPGYYNYPKTVNGVVTNPWTVYATTDKVNDAIKWIDKQDSNGNPWFAYVSFNAAHSPWSQFPPPELHSYDGLPTNPPIWVYLAQLEAMDTEIGRLLSTIDLRSVTVIFMGDNGTPGQVSPGTVRGAKGSVYEGGVHVPLIAMQCKTATLQQPAAEVPNTNDALLHATDVFESVMNFAGFKMEELVPDGITIDSVSFAPYVTNPSTPVFHDWTYTELIQGQTHWKAIRNANYKLIVRETGGGDPPTEGGSPAILEQLFNLTLDPDESEDLFPPQTFVDKANYKKLTDLLQSLHN